MATASAVSPPPTRRSESTGLAGSLAIVGLWRREFTGYSRVHLTADVLAGLNVGAVSLPLALAFGVASGATAAAGLVTAIISGLVMGFLGGAPFQVSGPTGAMAAILLGITATYGLPGMWLAGAMAGLIIMGLGLFRMGRLIQFIPSPVIVGFTSGIALVIASGQLDNVLGLEIGNFPQQYLHLIAVIENLGLIDWHAIVVTAIVIGTMVTVPRWNRNIPASLLGIALATIVANVLDWPVHMIGHIPRTILLPDRLDPSSITLDGVAMLVAPAVSIAVLASIKSLLCGTVGGNLTGVKMNNDQELIALGLGNLIIPFLGGVPASAAVARTSVAIRSGGRTRLVPIIHGLVLLAAALLIGPALERVPLAALGGVLLVTSVRVNDWVTMRFFVHRRLWHAVAVMLVTMVATYVFNLTQAVVIGMVVSVLWFVRQASVIDVSRQPVDGTRMKERGQELRGGHPGVEVVYVTGPLFFGNISTFLEALEDVPTSTALILSLRGMPTLDAVGVQAIEETILRQHHGGGSVHLVGLQPASRRRLERSGVLERLGTGRVHWSADQAITAIDAEHHAVDADTPAQHSI